MHKGNWEAIQGGKDCCFAVVEDLQVKYEESYIPKHKAAAKLSFWWSYRITITSRISFECFFVSRLLGNFMQKILTLYPNLQTIFLGRFQVEGNWPMKIVLKQNYRFYKIDETVLLSFFFLQCENALFISSFVSNIFQKTRRCSFCILRRKKIDKTSCFSWSKKFPFWQSVKTLFCF